jgi:DNA (cytosine-5)-methyltransferase 1
MTRLPNEILLSIYEQSKTNNIFNLNSVLCNQLDVILSRIQSNKGVFTVIITLALYKIVYPEQDIRLHKVEFINGFSGRSFDSTYVTPTLKQLKLPSMAESGWLTRSLEQPYPFNLDYKGKITPTNLKNAFLHVVDTIQFNPTLNMEILLYLMNGARNYANSIQITIPKLTNEEPTIESIILLLGNHFRTKYYTHGGSKLPVISLYTIYYFFMNQLTRYNDCELLPLGSHTASDRTSKSAGDIQIIKNGQYFEVIEVKFDKIVTNHIINVACDKIINFKIPRYFILSELSAKKLDNTYNSEKIEFLRKNYGSELIINGLLYSIKYYLRLLDSPSQFLNKYIECVESDSELQPCHKERLTQLITKIFF